MIESISYVVEGMVSQGGSTEPAAATDHDLGSSATVGKWRVAGLSLVVALFSAALVTFCFAPRFALWQGLSVADDVPSRTAEFDRAVPSLAQLNDPWARVENPVHRVLEWRLLFPLIWHYLGMPHWLYFAVPQVGCLLALWLVAALTYRRLGSWLSSWMAATLFAALPWFFVSSGWLLHFDSWLILGLLVAAFVPSRWALAITCLLTPWIDARFVLALPMTILVRAVALDRLDGPDRRELRLDMIVILLTSVPYPAIRAVAWLVGDPGSTQYVESHWATLRTLRWTRFARGLWSGYRLSWLLLGAAIVLTARRVGYRWGTLFAVVLAGSAVASLFIAHDMSRSLMIVSPAMLLGIWLWEEWRTGWLDRLLPSLLAVSLFLLPAEHVLWNGQWRINSLMAEIRQWQNPPPVFAAAHLMRRGRELGQAGKYAAAIEKLDTAIDTYKEFPQAYVERARVYIWQSDATRAEADLDEAIRLRPDHPNALLLRGIVRGSRGETSLAAEDFRSALRDAPPRWSHRAEAENLLAQVTRGEKLSLPTNRP